MYDVTFCLAAGPHVSSRGILLLGLCPGVSRTQRNISWTEILWTETYLDRDPLDKDTRYDIKRAVHILLECILVRFFSLFYYFAIVRLLFEVLEKPTKIQNSCSHAAHRIQIVICNYLDRANDDNN